MGCSGCSSGRGCSDSLPKGCKNNGNCGTGGCNVLNVFDWLAGMERPTGTKQFDFLEVRFKNTRKEFFRNVDNLELNIGDTVAVEAASGHDVGIVSLSGELVRLQMQKKGISPASREIRKLYRKAKESDIEKWINAQGLEHRTMITARKTAASLNLDMKISDVEYQGDQTKATFYYTADERVDFRELIKKLAEEFNVRIEMRQIGARQEAGKVGGIGSCGRELCCSTWLTDFRTVSTSAARYQQLAINPLKLAGQCGKLKCCLNYELDVYLESLRLFPKSDVKLLSEKGTAYHQKTDIFKKLMWYAYENEMNSPIAISVERVLEIIRMNKQGKKPFDIQEYRETVEVENTPDFENVVGQDSISRFDKNRSKKKKKKYHKRRK